MTLPFGATVIDCPIPLTEQVEGELVATLPDVPEVMIQGENRTEALMHAIATCRGQTSTRDVAQTILFTAASWRHGNPRLRTTSTTGPRPDWLSARTQAHCSNCHRGIRAGSNRLSANCHRYLGHRRNSRCSSPLPTPRRFPACRRAQMNSA